MAVLHANEQGLGRGVKYGRRYAQTEELFHAHQLERQLEALANEPDGPPSGSRGPPIGSIATGSVAPEDSAPRQAVAEASRRADAVGRAAKELWAAVLRLGRLPAEMLRRGGRRPTTGRPGWT